MKKMDIFCSSPASTAICSSLDHRSMVRRGTRPINQSHQYNYSSKSYNSCSSFSQSPINPKSFFEKSRKSTSSVKFSDFRSKSSSDRSSSTKRNDNNLRRKSSADINDFYKTKTKESSKHLLSEKIPYIDWISESDGLILDSETRHSTKPKRSNSNSKSRTVNYYDHFDLISEKNDRHSTKTRFSSSDNGSLKSSSSARSRDQVVVLWVSIHCKGCEGKIRKHISKMEGVTSFNVDLATKKVTVMGNVTPLGVLASVSKVKNAQLWPPPTPSIHFNN